MEFGLVQLNFIITCCSSAHGALPCAQPIVKVGGARTPVPHGVGTAGYSCVVLFFVVCSLSVATMCLSLFVAALDCK